jgi:uncharacterized membrane protein
VDHPVFGNEWMAWNLFLALIPAALAAAVFRPSVRRTAVWWAGAAAFVAFLPNAPYVLTDVLHLPADLRAASGSGALTLAVLGAYAGFAAAGFSAYAFSILRLSAYLRRAGLSAAAIVGVELSLHLLAAVGIVLGRVFRFNSWDLLARPEAVLDVVVWPQRERMVAIVGFLMISLAVGTLIVRALVQRIRRPPFA